MFNIGPEELIVILAVALVVLGPKRLPEVARQMARGLRELGRVNDQIKGELQGFLEEPPAGAPAAKGAELPGPDRAPQGRAR